MELDQDVPTHNELDRVRTLVLVEGVRLELGLKLPGLSGGNEHPEVPLVDFSIRLKHAFLFLVRVLFCGCSPRPWKASSLSAPPPAHRRSEAVEDTLLDGWEEGLDVAVDSAGLRDPDTVVNLESDGSWGRGTQRRRRRGSFRPPS